jgi:nitroreductase
MIKRSLFAVFVILFFGTPTLKSQTGSSSTIDVILSGYSAKMFTAIPVSDSQIDQVIKCGMKAPSGRNMQPWKFTVVKDDALVKEIIPTVTAGNILIVISGLEAKQPGMSSDFDCALATENMYVAAQSLGLGAHIYMGPVGNVNSKLKQILGIPDGYNAVALLRIGNIDKNVDATSSASTRKKPEEVITFK